jgi:hypothetical protein
MVDSLFGPKERAGPRTKDSGESIFEYLDASSHPAAAAAREIMNQWFATFPSSGAEGMRHRLRSDEPADFHAAYHELAIHALLAALGCTVQVHPAVAGTLKQPDFVVTEMAGSEFYLEAICSSGQSKQELGRERLEQGLLELIDEGFLGPYLLSVVVRAKSSAALSAKKVVTFLNNAILGLDPVEISNKIRNAGLQAAPARTYRSDGWVLEFGFVPFDQPRNSTILSHISTASGLQEVTVAQDLRTALRKKGSRYGELLRPYVIAVNSNDIFATEESMSEALFGELVVSRGQGLPPATVSSGNNGFWNGPNGPQFTRVSAVLFTRLLTVGNLQRLAAASLFLNRWSAMPYRGVLESLQTVSFHDTDFVAKPGKTLQEILRIDPNGPSWEGS